MKLVAITGSIGCGKTTIAKIVKKLGYSVYDIDAWVRTLYYKEKFIKVIINTFPEIFPDNIFDKRKLRKAVFANPLELKKLEGLIHPFLHQNLKNSITKHAKKDYIYFIDVALLFELGWDKYCDLIIVADAPYDVQKKRVMNRDNVSEEHFNNINDIQLDNKAKIELSDVVIDTDRSKNLIKVDVIEIINGILAE